MEIVGNGIMGKPSVRNCKPLRAQVSVIISKSGIGDQLIDI